MRLEWDLHTICALLDCEYTALFCGASAYNMTVGESASVQSCSNCHQEVDARAQVCRFCKTPLGKSGLFRSGRWIKGIAIALTVLSLISGLRSLSNLWLQRADQRQAIASSLDSALLMAETQQYELAWAQLDSAAELVGEPEILSRRVTVAMTWIRWLGSQWVSEQDYHLTTERLLPYLYRGLTEPGLVNVNDVRAHIVWANYLKSLVVQVDAEPIDTLEEILSDEADNLYSVTMLGFLKGRRDGYAVFDEIVMLFSQAGSPGDLAWVKRTQLSTLSGLLEDVHRNKAPFDQSLKIAKHYLSVAAGHLPSGSFSSAFSGWLFSLPDEHIDALEELLFVLEPDVFLELLPALYRNRGVSSKARYMFVRLEELRGDLDAARVRLSELTKPGITLSSSALRDKVGATQLRLGMEQTVLNDRSKRGYMRDEMPRDIEPWRFHTDTLLNFHMDWWGDNLDAAFSFYEEASPAANNESYLQTLKTLRQSRDRVKAYVDESERWLLQAGPSDDVESSLVAPRWSLTVIWFLTGHVAALNRDWDTAIVEWSDLDRRKLEDVTVDWELAVAHASRASLQNTGGETKSRDEELATSYLNEYVRRLSQEHESIPWDKIRAESAFSSIRSSTAYRDLLRGRP